MAAKRKDYRTQRAAEKAFERLRAKGIYDAGVVYDAMTRKYRLLWDDKKGNPGRGRKLTKKQRSARASRAAKQRGIVQAVKGLLKKTNPSAKITGARVVKLRDGVLKITPIKANRGRR